MERLFHHELEGVKKKNKELFFIQGKSFTLNGVISCENYETVRKDILEQRMNSGISCSLISNIEIVDQVLELFMAFTRASDDISFDSFYTFFTSVALSSRRNFRVLEANKISNIKMICTLNEQLIVDSVGGYNCKSDRNDIQGDILSFSLNTDEVANIEGIDNVNMKLIILI